MFGWRQKRTGDGRFTFDRKPVKPRTLAPASSTTAVDPDWDFSHVTDNPFAEIIANTWQGRDGFLSNQSPTPAAPATENPWDALTETSDYRFGPSNMSHARIDNTRRFIEATLDTPYSTHIPDGNGKHKHVEMTFNPSHVRDDIHRLATQVLEASRTIPGGRDYEPHHNVYSARTIAAARRIHDNRGQETFDTPIHERESTSWFPCTTHNTPTGVRYEYTLHPTIADLVHGAHDDQRAHDGLTADVREHSQRPRRPMPADW